MTAVQRALVVAVTGGIGSGKSTVSRSLARRGARVIDSDALAREVVAPGTPGLAAIARTFGAGVLVADGSLDRAALGAVVFGDAAARATLEGITHPLVRRLFAERAAEVDPAGVVVNDIPLVRTLADAARYHLVVTVALADQDERLARLTARGHSESDARSRIAAQIDDHARATLSDVVLRNDGTLDDLEPDLDVLWERLVGFARHRCAGTVPRHTASEGERMGSPSVPDVLRQRLADGAGVGPDRVVATGHEIVVAAAQPPRHVLQDIGFVGDGARWRSADPGLPVLADFTG